jgi:signal transduction histidine kinase
MMRLYAVRCMVLDRPAEAQKMLDNIVEQASQAIGEGRDAVHGMRASTTIKNDLAASLAAVGEGIASEQHSGSPVDFRVVVEGESRDLHPILRDEVFRIASEATTNAFRHSGARRIEVEICYDDRQFRVRVRDNGKGIDPKVLGSGSREGHFGLPGMQERAKLAGGKVRVWSKPDSGTEVELTIPASLAFVKSSTPR